MSGRSISADLDRATDHRSLLNLAWKLSSPIVQRSVFMPHHSHDDDISRPPRYHELVHVSRTNHNTSKSHFAKGHDRFTVEFHVNDHRREHAAMLRTPIVGATHNMRAHYFSMVTVKPDPWRTGRHRLQRPIRMHLLPSIVRLQPLSRVNYRHGVECALGVDEVYGLD
jgi:hypothetical protein